MLSEAPKHFPQIDRARADGQAVKSQFPPAPSVSVVVPCAGASPQLDAQLRAVLGQQCDFAFDVVVSVNTADTERVAAIESTIESIVDSRLRAVESADKRGAAHARNVGARAARGDLIAFCDDDLVHDGWLARLIGVLAGFDAVSGTCIRSSPPRQAHWRPPATEGKLPTFVGIPYILSGNFALYRAAFDAVGGFDETLTRCEDIAIGWALQSAGYSIGFEQGAGIDYYDRAGLTALVKQQFLYGRGMAEVLARYPKPGGRGGEPTSTLGQLRPNMQKAPLNIVGLLRKMSTAAGRLFGLAQTRLNRSTT